MPKGIYKRTIEHKKKISISRLGKKYGKMSLIGRKNISEGHKGKIGYWSGKKRIFTLNHIKNLRDAFRGDKSHFWKGGVCSKNQIDRGSLEYGLWRSKVFERDNWTCQTCGERGCYL